MALTTQVFTAGFNAATATITPVTAPAANQSILVRGLCLLVNATTILTFNSQLTGVGFGPFNFAAALTNPMVLPDLMPTEESDPFYTIIAPGTALVIANSTSANVSGYVRYSIK
jgi:hypothetical protein